MSTRFATSHYGLSRLLCVLAVVVTVGVGGWMLLKRSNQRARIEPESPSAPWFQETAARSGIDFVHMSGAKGNYRFPEIMSGGAGLLDYDGDGALDLYLVQGGGLEPSTDAAAHNRLYRNLGDGRFEDVTAQAGVDDAGYGMGCACGDYDGDGDTDLYVTNLGRNTLYRNDGHGTFTDVTADAGVGDSAWSTSAAFLDYDGDGHLDLFVVNYVDWTVERSRECYYGSGVRDYCGPKNFNAPAPDTLYRNNGDGTFSDESEAAGIRAASGNGLGMACADYNLDGHLDIYVANDGMPNQLWVNSGNGSFADESLISGCAVNMSGQSEAGMGVAAVDLDHDGDADLFMSHLRDETNTFYLNHGAWFEDVTAAFGLSAPSIAATGFGLGFADFDHDGQLDLYVANGSVERAHSAVGGSDPYAESNHLFAGCETAKFVEIGPPGGTANALVATSRAAAFGDLDNDGDVDVIVVNKDSRVHLLQNIAPKSGGWIMFRVLNRNGADALYADVRIEAGNGFQRRTVNVAYSYLASNDPRVHFGLGDCDGVERVLVRWPGSSEEQFGPFDANALYVLRQGTAGDLGSPAD